MLPNALQPNETDHVPVLAEEVRELLAVEPGHTLVDATFGSGGHAAVLAADLKGEGRFIAIDRDPTVRPYFEGFRRHAGVQSRFLRGEASVVLDQLAENGVHADEILLDLGISSMQIDRPERGFSYAVDAPLDMRMDPTADLSAAELVNEATERELVTIFRRYGEERYAKQIARAIARRRTKEPIERTGDLVEIIRAAIPAPARFGEGHPAKRVFQALRIAVNDELGELEEALPAAFEMLRPGGRLAVIAFHSLEDRIVKRFFQKLERGCICPPDFPICVCGKEPELRRLNRRAIRPSPHELAHNPRAASARLRAVQKVYMGRAAASARAHRRARAHACATEAATGAEDRAAPPRRGRSRLDRRDRAAAGRRRRAERRRPAAERPARRARPGALPDPRRQRAAELGARVQGGVRANRRRGEQPPRPRAHDRRPT